MENNEKPKYWINILTIKEYYLYSITPNEEEYKLFFGEKYKKFIPEQQQPTFQGLLSYIRNYKIDGYDVIITKNKK